MGNCCAKPSDDSKKEFDNIKDKPDPSHKLKNNYIKDPTNLPTPDTPGGASPNAGLYIYSLPSSGLLG